MNAAHTQFEFASFPRVYKFVVALDNIVSLSVVRDCICAFSDERTYTSNLRKFKSPVFAIKGGLGYGNHMDDTINLMSSTKVRVQNNPQFGHLDHYLVANHATYVEQPIVDWLNEDVFPNSK